MNHAALQQLNHESVNHDAWNQISCYQGIIES
jgi:hypothetical protein